MVSKFPTPRPILALLLGAIGLATALRAEAPASDARLVVVLTRHGVRAPLVTNASLGDYSAQAWPAWGVPPEFLTARGRQLMVLMGAYYRARYVQEGLLTGDPAQDRDRVFFRADSDERTVETGRGLAEGLLPGIAPEMHALPLKQTDPLFKPAKILAGRADEGLGFSAVASRMGGNPALIPDLDRPAYAALERVLFGGDGRTPPGKVAILDLPVALAPGKNGEVVEMAGPLRKAESLVDSLLLEYTDGMPAADVGWGRMDRATLTQLMVLHARYFDLTQRTFYPAQVMASNFVSHLLDTMDQALAGRPRAGAFGDPADRLVFVVGHDTNLANVGGLLGLSWQLPDTPADPILPGGALVFELRQPRGGGPAFVRTYYLSQSLDQMRTAEPLTLLRPPETSPIYVPGCSQAGPACDAPYDRFATQARRLVDPQFVIPGTP